MFTTPTGDLTLRVIQSPALPSSHAQAALVPTLRQQPHQEVEVVEVARLRLNMVSVVVLGGLVLLHVLLGQPARFRATIIHSACDSHISR